MKYFIAIILAISAITVKAQTINWQSLQVTQKHIANFNVGWDYAATLGVGYAYRMEARIPILLNTQLSLPAGNDFGDDLKAKLGAQARVFSAGNFQGAVSVYGIFRQTKSSLVRLQNFGSEFTGVVGYYRPRWFVATEFGFDKAIVTNIKHSDQMRQNYPAVRDGWYIPTGGNFTLGIQTGYSMRSVDLYLKAGKIIDQYLNSSATVPLTCQIGVNVRF